MKLLRRKLVLVLVVLALVGAAAGWYIVRDAGPVAGLTVLNPSTFAELRNEFNGAAGTTRIIVLLSPS